MKGKNLEKLVSNLKNVMRCPHCSSTYTLDDIHYLGQLDSMTFLHMRCASCKTPVFASVALSTEDGELSPADFTAEDIAMTDPQLSIDDYTLDSLDNMDAGFSYKTLDTKEEPTDVPIQHLTAEQIMNSLTPVAYDDVLDMHSYMESFDGDFEKIIR